jgi:hypothetical protein
MAQTDLLSRLLDAGMTFTGLSRARAEEVVRDLLRAGAMQAEHTQSNIDALVDELIERSRRNGERFIQTVRAELDEQAARLDPPTRDDIEKIVHRFADVAMSLLRQVTERGDASPPHRAVTRDALRPTPQAPTGATPAGVQATEPAMAPPPPPAGAVTAGVGDWAADWAGKNSTATPSGRMGDTMTGAAKAPARTAATRKATGRKAVAKRPTAKKAATRKSAAKKTTARKTAAKKTARKSAAKKTARKSAAKKTTARKTAAKKTARKSAAKKTTARKTAAKKTARKTAAKKTARKTAAKRSTAKKSAAKKAAAKKGPARKTAARKTAARKTAAKRAASR